MQVMGGYYPRSVLCDPALFAQGATAMEGARACFQAAGQPFPPLGN